jgi:hypothetical protein
MSIRILLLTTLLFCLCLQFTEEPRLFGQATPNAQFADEMTRQLNLSPLQKSRLIPILSAEAPQIKAIQANKSLSSAQKLDRIRSVHARNDPRVRAILNREQYFRLQQMRLREIPQGSAK